MLELVERSPVTYQDYSPERKAEVIELVRAAGGNVLQVSKTLGIAETTIRYWIEHQDRFREFREQKSLELADLAENNARRLGLSINTCDLSEVPLNHQATAFGIMVDKMQLLRGQPTSISVNVERQELAVVLAEALGEVIDVQSVDSAADNRGLTNPTE